MTPYLLTATIYRLEPWLGTAVPSTENIVTDLEPVEWLIEMLDCCKRYHSKSPVVDVRLLHAFPITDAQAEALRHWCPAYNPREMAKQYEERPQD